jgi:hypothetical protein
VTAKSCPYGANPWSSRSPSQGLVTPQPLQNRIFSMQNGLPLNLQLSLHTDSTWLHRNVIAPNKPLSEEANATVSVSGALHMMPGATFFPNRVLAILSSGIKFCFTRAGIYLRAPDSFFDSIRGNSSAAFKQSEVNAVRRGKAPNLLMPLSNSCASETKVTC